MNKPILLNVDMGNLIYTCCQLAAVGRHRSTIASRMVIYSSKYSWIHTSPDEWSWLHSFFQPKTPPLLRKKSITSNLKWW